MRDEDFDGAAVKAARTRLHMSMPQLARLLDVNPQTIWNWEAGRQNIASPSMLARAIRDIENEQKRTEAARRAEERAYAREQVLEQKREKQREKDAAKAADDALFAPTRPEKIPRR